MRVAICDDSAEQRAAVLAVLAQQRPGWHCEGFCRGEDLLEASEDGVVFDLIFMDIYMDGISGMETARALRRYDGHAALVFLTTSRDFAVESYKVEAFDYLVKPVGREEILGLLERFDTAYRPKTILIHDRLFVADDIAYIESRDKKAIFHFVDGASAEITAKMDEVEERLIGGSFLRCHRSYIINMDLVSRVDGRDFVLSTGDRVPIRRQDFSQLRERYFRYVTSL